VGDVQAPQTRLSGQWQAKNPVSGETLTLIFTPDGKFFVLLPSGSETPVAQQLGYRIDPVPQPMHIDVTFPGTNESVKTIFEFTADGQLRLQVAETNPGEPRPTAFSPSATLFKKVSDATTLPGNAQVSDLQSQVNRAQQSEGKQYVGSMNRVQQAYYLENQKFANEINELGIGIKPETENYRYRIVPQGNSTQSVMMTAQAKRPELRSYTGAVFVVKDNNENLTIAAICETDQPSSTPPAMPIAPSNIKTPIQCPSGSHRLGR
jgi:type II secretory pathway pseudopilin PulG